MKLNHLTESEIEQYAVDRSSCDKEISEHIGSCPVCKASAEAYLKLFSAIREQPKPAFDFDLTGLVMQKLQLTKSKFSLDQFVWYLLALVALVAIFIPGYFFRKYISNIFAGIVPITMYLILLITFSILVFLGFELYRKYQQQISLLN